MLTAEAAGDHAGSYSLLSSDARRDYPNVEQWARDRQQLPAVTRFEVTGVDGDVVEAVVEHTPGLDPFVGLSAGREVQRWTAVEEDGSWFLDAEPDIEPQLPPEDDAGGAAVAWAQALQACDDAGAAALQGVTELFGSSAAANGLCGVEGGIANGEVDEVRSGPASAELVAQYSTDALVWARAVPLEGPTGTFEVILAPLGDAWRVIGVVDR